MTRYDKYEKKLLKLRKVRDFFYRFRIFFITFITLAVLTSASLIGITGVVTSTNASDNAYIYGEKYSFSGQAIFSDVIYEYKEADSEIWSSEKPYKVGQYNYRYYSYGAFNVKYSDVKTFSIIPRRVDIKILEDAIIYGNKPHIEHEDLMFDDKVKQFNAIFKDLTTIKTDVYVEKSSVVIVDGNGSDITYCYDIVCPIKNLKVVERDFYFDFKGGQKIYDGTPLSNDDYEITKGQLAYEDTLHISKSLSITDPGKIIDERKIYITNKDNVDVTHLYEIKKNDPIFIVDKRPLLISTSNHEKEYDGLPFDLSYEIKDGSLLEGHHINETFAFKDLQDVDTRNNDINIQILDNENKDVSRFYDIKYEIGTLKINKRKVHIKTASESKIYDDKILFNKNYEFLDNTSLAKDEVLDITKYNAINDVGKVENAFEFNITRFGRIVTDNYDLTINNGELRVDKRPLQVTIQKTSKVYDGYPLSITSFDTDNLLDHHVAAIINNDSITQVGTINADNFAIDIFNVNNGISQNTNYDVSYFNRENAIEITKRPLEITTCGADKIYDGRPLFRHEYEFINNTSLADTDHIEVEFTNEITNHGSIANVMEYTIYNKEGLDVTFCYDVHINFENLIVNKMPINVYCYDEYKVYDAQPFKRENAVYAMEDLPENHFLTGDIKCDEIDAGIYPLQIILDSIKIVDNNGIDKTDNFIIALANRPATLTIEKRYIKMQPEFASKVYDGTPIKASEYKILEGEIVANQVLSCSFAGEITYPDETYGRSIIVNPSVYSNTEGKFVTYNYEIETLDGLLEILPIHIVVSSITIEKVYDGQEIPLSDYEYFTLKEGYLLSNHNIKFKFNNKPVKNVIDSRENDFEIWIYDNNVNDVTRCYDIDYEFGNLNILPRPISIDMDSYSTTYKGQPVELGIDTYMETTPDSYPLYMSSGELMPGYKFMASSYLKLDLPNDEKSKLTLNYFILKPDDTMDDAYNYTVTYANVYLRLKKIRLVIQSKNGRKEYDGNPFENKAWIAQGRLLSGHEITYSVDQTITDVGSYQNHITDIHIYDEHGQDVQKMYYNIDTLEGRITITRGH